jgi:hypothetical protein
MSRGPSRLISTTRSARAKRPDGVRDGTAVCGSRAARLLRRAEVNITTASTGAVGA